MRTTIDAAGRIVIPKKMRDEIGLSPGAEVEVSACDGVIRIEVPSVDFHLERRGHLLVLVPDEDVPPMTKADFDRVRKDVRDERFRAATGGMEPYDEPD